jgi:hypothetical protein
MCHDQDGKERAKEEGWGATLSFKGIWPKLQSSPVNPISSDLFLIPTVPIWESSL